MFDWAAACELNIKLAHIETRRAKVVIQVMAGACVFLFILFIPVKPATSEPPAAFFGWGSVSFGAGSIRGNQPASYCCLLFVERLVLRSCAASRLLKERAT